MDIDAEHPQYSEDQQNIAMQGSNGFSGGYSGAKMSANLNGTQQWRASIDSNNGGGMLHQAANQFSSTQRVAGIS